MAYEAAGGLGYCFSEQCVQGKTAVDQMMSTWNELRQRVDASKTYDFTFTFQPPVRAIKAAYDALDDGIYIETFNSKCCQVAELGKQAQTLTSQMTAWVNDHGTTAASVPGSTINAHPENPADTLANMTKMVTYAMIGLAGLWAYSTFFKK